MIVLMLLYKILMMVVIILRKNQEKMTLAIIERIENIEEKEPFNNRYYLTDYYKKIFDEF